MRVQNLKSRVYDVAVVGAGVFGAWTAYELQRNGKQVLLIEPYGPGNSRSSSGGESRILRMGYGADEMYTRSANTSVKRWRELFAQVDEPLLHRHARIAQRPDRLRRDARGEAVERRPIRLDGLLGRREIEDRLGVAAGRGSGQGH